MCFGWLWFRSQFGVVFAPFLLFALNLNRTAIAALDWVVGVLFCVLREKQPQQKEQRKGKNTNSLLLPRNHNQPQTQPQQTSTHDIGSARDRNMRGAGCLVVWCPLWWVWLGKGRGVVYFRGKDDLSVWLHGSLRIISRGRNDLAVDVGQCGWKGVVRAQQRRRVAQPCGVVTLVFMSSALDDKGG